MSMMFGNNPFLNPFYPFAVVIDTCDCKQNPCLENSPLGGFSIGLAGYGMQHKIEAGSGIQEILRAGYGMKIS